MKANLSDYRNNALLWIGVIVPWIVGIGYSLTLRHLFPNEHPLDISTVAAFSALFGLFAGGPALFSAHDGWLGRLGRMAYVAVGLAFGVMMTLYARPAVESGSRWPYIVAGEIVMLATLWSFVFGWLAVRRGDRRFLEIHSATQPA